MAAEILLRSYCVAAWLNEMITHWS